MTRIILFAILALIVAIAIGWFVGPRVAADTTISFDPESIGPDAEAYLAAQEAKNADLRPDTAKEIVWAFPHSRAKTPLAIVYVHGFSATKSELRPVPDKVAAALRANLYFARLAGHGGDGAAMLEGSINRWVNDYAEAIAIGRTIGEKVLVVATSTGASLATWAATQPELSRDVVGLVLVSPNYGVQAAGAFLLTWPWGGAIADLVAGAERGFEPQNEAHGRFWTTRYPTAALLPMAALADLAYRAPVTDATVPALFIFSDKDAIVLPERTRAVMERWGGPHEALIVEGSDDPADHVIAGDALSPSTTTLVAERIIAWAASLTPRP